MPTAHVIIFILIISLLYNVSSQVVINEVSTGDPDYIELRNLSPVETINITGWIIRSDIPDLPNKKTPDIIVPNLSLSPGEVHVFSDSPSTTPSQCPPSLITVGVPDVDWGPSKFWVSLLSDSENNEEMDYVVFGNITISGNWTGTYVPKGNYYGRASNIDTNSRVDWKILNDQTNLCAPNPGQTDFPTSSPTGEPTLQPTYQPTTEAPTRSICELECICPPPSPEAICLNSTWSLATDVTLEPIIVLRSSLEVDGAVNFSQNITISIGAEVIISGCANLQGSLTIDLSNVSLSSLDSVRMITYACHRGEFDSVAAVNNDECKQVNASPNYRSTAMLVNLRSIDICASEDEGIAVWIYPAVAVVVFIVVVGVAASILGYVAIKASTNREKELKAIEEALEG